MGRYSPIFPNDSRIFFREKKHHQFGRVFPSHFPSQFMEMMRFRGKQVGFIFQTHGRWGSMWKKKSGCQGVRVSGWGSMMFHVFVWLNASWAHPAPTFRVSSRSICGFGSLEVRGWSFSGGDWDHESAVSSRVFGADLSFVWWFNAGILLPSGNLT